MKGSFIACGVAQALTNVLDRQGIRTPTPIQELTIPQIFKGKDVLGRAQTGTGKTLAYLLPVLQKVEGRKGMTQAIILTPTRELAEQIQGVARPLAEAMGVDVAAMIGGRTIENQIQKLKRDPDIIIGTPGRLLDHITRRTLDLSHCRICVLDEVDQMLAGGFREDMDLLLSMTPKKRQVLFFSATLTPEAQRLGRKYMKQPFQGDVSEKATASTVEQRIYETTKGHKFSLLVKHLKEMNPYMALVFCNTREEAHELAGRLAAETHMPLDEIHGDMSQSQRNQVIREFAKARLQVLVASDVAARGIDVEGVTHVFNYGIPRNLEYYVHRIGRTGRAGTKGLAVTYVTPEDGSILRRLERSIQETITRYDETGRVRRVRQGRPQKKSVIPGMYKPTKKKEHKALGHKGRNMRQKRKEAPKKGR